MGFISLFTEHDHFVPVLEVSFAFASTFDRVILRPRGFDLSAPSRLIPPLPTLDAGKALFPLVDAPEAPPNVVVAALFNPNPLTLILSLILVNTEGARTIPLPALLSPRANGVTDAVRNAFEPPILTLLASSLGFLLLSVDAVVFERLMPSLVTRACVIIREACEIAGERL